MKDVLCLESIFNSHIVSGSCDGDIYHWDVEKEINIGRFEGHSHYVWKIVNINHNLIVSCSSDKTVKLY